MKFLFVFIVSLFYANFSYSQDAMYVWNFSHRDGSTSYITQSLTEEFEEALLQSQCCELLQRRHYSRLFNQIENEKSIVSLRSLSTETVKDLKKLNASTVIFGEIFDDTNSGKVKVTINFESFNGAIEKKASTYIPKFAINDPEKREEAVDDLLAELNIGKLKKPERTSIIDDWEINLIGCSKEGNNVQCKFSLTSNFRDRYFSLKGVDAYDNYGNSYRRKRAGIANYDSGTGFKVRLIDGVETEGFVLFENIDSRATTFKVLEFKVYADDLSKDIVQFRDVTIE